MVLGCLHICKCHRTCLKYGAVLDIGHYRRAEIQLLFEVVFFSAVELSVLFAGFIAAGVPQVDSLTTFY